MIVTRRFNAMGTTIEGGLRTTSAVGGKLWTEITARIKAFQDRFSRFDRKSELSHINHQAGQPTPVSPEMVALLRTAEAVVTMTDGIVDPTIGRALVIAGYDTSFDLIQDRPDEEPVDMTTARTDFSHVQIDDAAMTVTIPTGTLLDFGGLGKGYLLDTLRPLIEAATKDYWLSFGGDLLVSGTDDKGRPWTTGVQNPTDLDHDQATLTPPAGRWGIATSGITKRRGVRRGRNWHHIIDPRTGAPSETDVLSATVIAPTALQADVYAKSVVIRGTAEGLPWIKAIPEVEALISTLDDQMIMTPGMSALITKP